MGKCLSCTPWCEWWVGVGGALRASGEGSVCTSPCRKEKELPLPGDCLGKEPGREMVPAGEGSPERGALEGARRHSFSETGRWRWGRAEFLTNCLLWARHRTRGRSFISVQSSVSVPGGVLGARTSRVSRSRVSALLGLISYD